MSHSDDEEWSRNNKSIDEKYLHPFKFEVELNWNCFLVYFKYRLVERKS